MKKEVKDKWIKALRSGKYKQTRGRLHNQNGGGYCCLGVLCEVTGLEYDKDGLLLDQEIVNFAGMRSDCGKYQEGSTLKGNSFSLSVLNDSRKWSFKKIADFIEDVWETL